MYAEWDKLESVCRNCVKCGLSETRQNVVFGVGNRSAKLMIVGEGPGQQEDEKGEPFVGRAGQLLDKLLDIVEIKREDIYITNIVKCRPPGNRDPLPEEQDSCIDYLRNQLLLIKPKIIVCLGRISGQKIISKDFKITSDHGTFYERGDYIITSSFHPSYLLRDITKKPLALDDFKEIKRRLDLL